MTIVTQECVRSTPIPVTRTLGQEQEELLRTQLGADKLELCVSASLMTSDLSESVMEGHYTWIMSQLLFRELGDGESYSHLRSDFCHRGFLLVASDLPREELGCQTSEKSWDIGKLGEHIQNSNFDEYSRLVNTTFVRIHFDLIN